MRLLLAGVLALAACGPPEEIGAPPPANDGDIAVSCDELETEPEVDGPLSDDADVAEAQRQRAGMGLASDEETVREIIAETDEDAWEMAFPHTDEEVREVMARNEAAEDAGVVREWAQAEAPDAFAGLWLDQQAGGVLTVAFADDVDAHRGTVHERFGEDIRVVEAEHAHADLERVAEEVAEDMRGDHEEADRLSPEPGTLVGVGVSERHNRVSIGVVGGDDEALVEVTERYGADRICLEVHVPPEQPDPDGPVTTLAKAAGWRGGLDEAGSPFAFVEIAYDRETAEQAWADNVPDDLPTQDGLPAEPGIYGSLDDVDFDTQAVLVWSSGESGTCPGWLADVETVDGTLHLERDAAGTGACTDDYNPYRMVLAVDRDRLPDPDALSTADVDGVPDAQVDSYPASD